MRKLYLLSFVVILLILSGCTNNVNSNIYISSIGFEVKEDKLVSYFLSNPLTNISRQNSDDKENDTEYVKVETNSVYDAFIEAEQSLLFPLNYRHVKTVIFHVDVFKTKYVDDFFEFMKSVKFISFNYYVFATSSKLEELYDFQTPEQISYQYSVLSSPDLLNFHQYGSEKEHFLDFANAYYTKERYLHLPLLTVNETWKDKSTIEVDGFFSVNTNTSFLNKEYKGMLYLYDFDTLTLNTEKAIYTLTNYQVNKYVKDNVYTFKISYDDILIIGEGSSRALASLLKKEISAFFDAYIKVEGGLYMIRLYNYLNKKALDVSKYNIECKM